MVQVMHKIKVSIIYANNQQQWLKEATLRRGASVSDLIEDSNFLTQIQELVGQTIDDLTLGIYAQKVSHDALLEEGDRVEIYRPLAADPKEVRRQLALLGKTIGNKQP
jgi:uncharacterized protein